MRSFRLAAAVVLCGCVTPAAVKTASQQHAENLAALRSDVRAYADLLDRYYASLRARQRDAYVAQRLGEELDRIVGGQLAEGRPAAARPAPDAAGRDFIAAGVALADAPRHWATNFDLWVDGLPGATLADKRLAITERVRALDAQIAAARAAPAPSDARLETMLEARRQLQALAGVKDADLAYPAVALALEGQRRNLREQLDLLALEVEVMGRVHDVVNEYLQVDATIDGDAIARSLQAGGAVDVSQLTQLRDVVGGGAGVSR